MANVLPILFDSDGDYEEWRNTHADAVVLNTSRSYDQTSSVVHRFPCSVLDRAARDTTPGRLTGGDYVKVGASSVEQARDWLRSKRKTTSARLCSVCFKFEIADRGSDGMFGFAAGALYNRKDDLHGRFGGQAQGGMSTPKDGAVILLFTGDAGLEHGYRDDWDDDGFFHYVGEGQVGNMSWSGANLAVREQPLTDKAILLFRALGKGRPYRFVGRFDLVDYYERSGVPDRNDQPRTVIVFRLKPLETQQDISDADAHLEQEETSTTVVRSVEVLTKQALFRKRLAVQEDGCRVTGICDLRFLTASHIKPWSHCSSSAERVDGSNGLLLAPHIDHLFDRGWITFGDRGDLVCSKQLPDDVRSRLSLAGENLCASRSFTQQQKIYLEFHRERIFRH